MKLEKKQEYLIHAWSDKAFKGTFISCKSWIVNEVIVILY